MKNNPSEKEFRDQLLQELSHFNMHYVAKAAGNDPGNLEKIISLMLNDHDPVPPRAAWVAEIISAENPGLIEPWIPAIIEKMNAFTHPGTRRNTLKILERHKVEDEDLQGLLIETCFQWISDRKKTTAVKVFAMQIIANYLTDYPELGYELSEIIREQFPDSSPGFKNRGQKILDYIQKVCR